MAIKRYYATKDNTITNAYKANLNTRGVSGNMGESDILEVFHIYGQAASASQENTRLIIEFNTSSLSNDRTSAVIPTSGNVEFYLKLYNAPHSQTTPKNFTLVASAITGTWDEGLGLDMENYSDLDASNWLSKSAGLKWTTEGGDYYTDTSSSFSQSFDTGFENLEINISTLVEQWLSSSANSKKAFNMGEKKNYGIGIKLSPALEVATNSYYTKMFFARNSQFFFKRPVIEARWDSTKKDNRGDFYLSSSLVPAGDNLMKLYLYNIVKGELTNIPDVGTGNMFVSIYSGSEAGAPAGAKLGLALGGGTVDADDVNTTASWVETGIYSCSFAYTSSAITRIFDVWHKRNSSGVEFHTGSVINVKTFDSKNYNFDQKYVSNIVNLRALYSQNETARFRVYVRKKDWSPTIYNVASKAIETSIIDNAYYKIVRVRDELEVISFGTGSLNHTRLSYDLSGSYFDLDMSMLDTDTVYDICLAYLINGSYVEQPERFRFRME